MSMIEFFSQPVWSRLGLSLVHFLWQGLLLVILAGLYIKVFKVKRGNSRYLIYLVGFLLMIACPVITYMTIDIPEQNIIASQVQQENTNGAIIIPVNTPSSTTGNLIRTETANSPVTELPSKQIPISFSQILSNYLPWLLISWIIGVLLLGIRLVMGFIGIHRWSRNLQPIPENLINRVKILSERLNLQGFSRIFISPFASQAMAIGYLRPKVLLPVSMITQMQPEMLEAVIAHELAHIRRFDLWINLIQRIAEILLFYHPAIWWLSNKLRDERELCCDELAANTINNRLVYASALELAGKTQLLTKQPILAAGLGKDDKPTLNRVRHILNIAPAQNNSRFWLAGVVAVLLLIGISISTALSLNSARSNNTAIESETPAQALTRSQSAKRLRRLGEILMKYVNDYEGTTTFDNPDLSPYMNEEDIELLADFVTANIEFIPGIEGMQIEHNPEKIPIGYDKTILQQRKSTNVLFADGFVDFLNSEELEKLGITAQTSYFEIEDVNFEPIHQGKNIVHITVKNTSDVDRTYRVNIYTRSPELGEDGIGWGTSFFATIKANQRQSVRFSYKIQGPITGSTYVRLDHYDMGLASDFDENELDRDIEWFKRVTYPSSELKKDTLQKAVQLSDTDEKTKAVVSKFQQIQEQIKNKEYEKVWESFTQDYKDAEYQIRTKAFEKFKKAMEPEHPLDSAFVWEKEDFLKLKPKNVFEQNDIVSVEAFCDDFIWTIDFKLEDNQWKIDWIGGYIPRVISLQNWQEVLIPKLNLHETDHFDIHYFENSTAEKEIEQIAEIKEKGYNEICKFLNVTSELRIRLILFEDQQKKMLETGHQGDGWAFNNTIVEIYNEKTKLDPYHETTHILMRPFGNPPALFNEGFAVYMSERLGDDSLKNLGGGNLKIYERVAELKAKNELWDLKELIGFNEIGSLESRSQVAYPQAASFVKFLIDAYGKDKFLETYKTLVNGQSSEKSIQRLEGIYKESFRDLEKEWIKTIEK
ncbi:MAG: M48 family metalloprotease [Sedimentisphaerales bacterium]|nr:M48 family metalloprotease [Sedimentisphaerales bacterium]